MEVKGNLVVSNRDMALVRQRLELGDGSLFVVQTSIESASKIPETKCVRGEVTLMGSHIEPTSESSCKITNVSLVDPKGSIPSSFINKMKSRQHDVFVAIKTKLEA